MTRIVEALTLVSEVEKQQILRAPKSPDSHRKLMKAVPAMSEIEKVDTPVFPNGEKMSRSPRGIWNGVCL